MEVYGDRGEKRKERKFMMMGMRKGRGRRRGDDGDEKNKKGKRNIMMMGMKKERKKRERKLILHVLGFA